MKLVKIAREKLVEKDIEWKQVYTDKTLFLKEQFEDVVGPGSYFRFEGVDRDTGNEYYCIVGPAKIHDPIAKFFAGVRKMPATYSAGGKYFDSLDGAANYARETWGVPTPRSLRPYTASALKGIKDKVEEWKEAKEEKEASNNTTLDKIAARPRKEPYVTPLPTSDLAAIQEQKRTKVNDQREYATEKAMKTKTEESVADMSRQEEMEIINRYGKDIFDIAKANFEGSDFARETGVGSQVGTLSWDDRGTAANVDKRGPVTVLDLILLTDDILATNPNINTLEQVPPAKGSKLSTFRVTVPGKGNRYLTRDALKGYMRFLQYIKDQAEESKGAFKEEEKGKYEGKTTSLLGDPDDEWAALQREESPEDYLEDIGVDIDKRNEFASEQRKKKVFATTIKNLIKIAKDEDDKGNYSHAEEIHKVIRKYKERIK